RHVELHFLHPGDKFVQNVALIFGVDFWPDVVAQHQLIAGDDSDERHRFSHQSVSFHCIRVPPDCQTCPCPTFLNRVTFTAKERFMADLPQRLDDLRRQLQKLPDDIDADTIAQLERTARALLTDAKNTSYEAAAQALFGELARKSNPTSPT